MPEDQRTHMKSDWHRYNLKRRVAQLPPIDEDLFNTKVASLSVNDEELSDTKKQEKQLTKKELRRREKEALLEKKRQILETAKQAMLEKMKNEGMLKEEIFSKLNVRTEKESDAVAIKKEEESVEELTPEQEQEKLLNEKIKNRVEIPSTTCLFCHPKKNANFETTEESVNHMCHSHGLYIPEPKYLVDKEGLLKYLGEKIGLGNVCLVCSYQGKDVEAVREHMLNKRHMRIPYESENEKLEISEFYDFRSTYDDYVVATEDDPEDDVEWEDVSSEEGDEDDEDALPDSNKNSIYQHGKELILPSGTVLGHRSLARYYRQNLPPDRILSEGQGTVIAAETRHFIDTRDRTEIVAEKRAWARQKKREDINDRRAAKFVNNQPYYRDQLLQ